MGHLLKLLSYTHASFALMRPVGRLRGFPAHGPGIGRVVYGVWLPTLPFKNRKLTSATQYVAKLRKRMSLSEHTEQLRLITMADMTISGKRYEAK